MKTSKRPCALCTSGRTEEEDERDCPKKQQLREDEIRVAAAHRLESIACLAR